MAKAIFTAVLIVMLNVLVGCGTIDSGRGQLLPIRSTTSYRPGSETDAGGGAEVDIVERVAAHRLVYRQDLELLLGYYNQTGNHMKSKWAKKELAALDAMPQYKYIVEAEAAGPGLKASKAIPEADYLYWEAMEFEKKAGVIIRNENFLRLALDRYDQLIRQHPSSDKIDDAAYKAGGIYESFRDYRIALLHYQRTYQWDRDTIYPARFRVAFIYDKHLREMAKALEAYQEAVDSVTSENEHLNWRKFAEKRIRQLTKTEEGTE